jgi:hypothetical protein
MCLFGREKEERGREGGREGEREREREREREAVDTMVTHTHNTQDIHEY